jgi:hypothetical protein
MRFPIRDVIPSRTRPLVSWTCLVLSAVWLLADHPALVTLGAVLLHALPMMVLGETVEDQLGHARHAALLAVVIGVTLALDAGSAGVLPAMTAGIIGAHLALFPTARILVAFGFDVVEIPSFFLAGCWVLLVVMVGAPLAAPAAAVGLSAAGARLLRQRDRSRWEHFDHAR